MQLLTTFNHHRNDFHYTMQCEYCPQIDTCKTGYNDANYFNNVIPAKYCSACKRNSKGVLSNAA